MPRLGDSIGAPVQSMEWRKPDVFDRANGAAVGSAVGDAAGGVLEFALPVGVADVDYALNMLGGGVHRLEAGQVTDDTEMAICVLQAIAESFRASHKQTQPSLQTLILKNFSNWYKSAPVDIGNTTSNALEVAEHGVAATRESVSRWNGTSQSNGSLMRCAAWGTLLFDMPNDVIEKAVELDVSLTHCHPNVLVAETAYMICLCQIIFDGNRIKAYHRAKQWLDGKAKLGGDPTRSALAAASHEVLLWLYEATESAEAVLAALGGIRCTLGGLKTVAPLRLQGPKKSIGWIRWGFELAFRSILAFEDYETSLRDCLLHGGDTDTNAAIVGTLMGACCGFLRLPEQLVDPVITVLRSCPPARQPRPLWVHPSVIPPLIDALIEEKRQVDFREKFETVAGFPVPPFDPSVVVVRRPSQDRSLAPGV